MQIGTRGGVQFLHAFACETMSRAGSQNRTSNKQKVEIDHRKLKYRLDRSVS